VTIQEDVKVEAALSAAESIRPASHGGTLLGRWAGSRRHLLVVIVLIFSDVVLALAAWQVAFVLHGTVGRWPLSEIAIVSTLPYVAVWIGLRASMGLYPGYGLGHVEVLRRQTFALLATLMIILVFAFTSLLADSLSRVLLGAWAVSLLLAAPLARSFVEQAIIKAGLWGKPVLVIGAQETGAQVLKVLQREWQLGFKPVGLYDDHLVSTEGALESVPYWGTLTEAVSVAQEHGVDTAIFAMPHMRREHLAELVNLASASFRYVIVMPNLNGITNSAVVTRDFAGDFGVEVKHNHLLDPWARRIKGVLDLSATVVGGLLISPLLIAITIAIKLDSPGPAFYGHRRLGIGGNHFRCWKFRTMNTNAEQLLNEFLQGNPALQAEWEQNFKLRDDPRVTRVGRFLRKISLDELPQLWNVLRGEMSLVGPRPIVDAEVPKYGAVYKMYQRIKPGMSGLWQISGRSDMGYDERVKLDAYYVHNWSVWLDLMILARTVWSVALSRGAC